MNGTPGGILSVLIGAVRYPGLFMRGTSFHFGRQIASRFSAGDASSRLAQARADQFRQILPRHRAAADVRLVKAPQVKLVPKLALDFLPQPIMRHSSDKIRAELNGALFRADDFQPRLALGLKRAVHEKLQR